tara:strand:- start:438 stop:692 length:255 start_codon:yes stop_codon:yes gene_type:complete
MGIWEFSPIEPPSSLFDSTKHTVLPSRAAEREAEIPLIPPPIIKISDLLGLHFKTKYGVGIATFIHNSQVILEFAILKTANEMH